MNVDDFLEQDVSRRRFLSQGAAGVAAGVVGIGRTATAEDSPSHIVRLGVIGVRSQGKTLGVECARVSGARVISVCDVDESMRARAAVAIEESQHSAPKQAEDFRRLLDDPEIDAVLIATPDHWHAVMTILACQAGKDVYVEKPASQTIREGRAMIAAAEQHGRVVQCGLQQRSGDHFRSAVEFVQSGQLGTVRLAKAWSVHRRQSLGHKPDGPPPPGVNYDLWLGPAAEQPFNVNRFHYNWRWNWQFGSGELGNWGVHLLDVARWGLDVALPGRVAASGGSFYFDDDQQTPDTLTVTYSYPDAAIVWEHRCWSQHGNEGRSAAVAFFGDQGTLIVDRSGWKVYGCRESHFAGASELRQAHLVDFLDAVRTRRFPACDIRTGHISSALCHLGNAAYRLGREIVVDPETETFSGDSETGLSLDRQYRQPWALPVV